MPITHPPTCADTCTLCERRCDFLRCVEPDLLECSVNSVFLTFSSRKFYDLVKVWEPSFYSL